MEQRKRRAFPTGDDQQLSRMQMDVDANDNRPQHWRDNRLSKLNQRKGVMWHPPCLSAAK
jgi:hypothetical protein